MCFYGLSYAAVLVLMLQDFPDRIKILLLIIFDSLFHYIM